MKRCARRGLGGVSVNLVLNRRMDVGRWRAFVSKRKVEGRHGDADLSANLHVMKYSWVEPKHRKWQQSPPRVEVEVEESSE